MTDTPVKIPDFLQVDKDGRKLFTSYNPKEARPATGPMKSFAQKLFRSKVTHPDFVNVLEEEIDSWTYDQCGDFLKKMKIQPDANKKAKVHRQWHRPEIPHGCYLVDVPGKTGTLEMWLKVDQSTGRETKIFRLRGAPGKLASKRIDRVTLLEHLTPVLLLDPQAAMERFATELEHCMRCGSPLTNDESRARMLGPDCWEHLH